MVTTDADVELMQQLKEAGKQLSELPESEDELFYVLDQTEKLLSKVDQSPDSLMQEAMDQPMKALLSESLLNHLNVDVKVLVALCLCEITRITAPDAPYSDDAMKGVLQSIVSSFENLSDNSSRSYDKRVSILETVYKVRLCVVMLDLDCDDLIVQMFEYFLNSVRDHHLNNIFPLMVDIIVLVLEESEDISADMINPLLASIKNNSEGVLPVARKLGEDVLKKSADKLKPYLKNIVTSLGGSLDSYSQVLTSICEGTLKTAEHNDESASVQPMVTSNGKKPSGNKGGSDDKQSEMPEEAVDHPGSNGTGKVDEPVTEKSGNIESKEDPASKRKTVISKITVKSLGPSGSSQKSKDTTEKTTDISVPAQKKVEIEIANAPSQSGSHLEETEPANGGIMKGKRSRKQRSLRTEVPSKVVVSTKVPEGTSDSDIKSPKRARKSTSKVEENRPSATSERLNKTDKKVDGGDSVAKKSKLSGKKTDAGESESKKSKQPAKKVESKAKPSKQTLKKDKESDGKPLKQTSKKGVKSKVIAKASEEIANKDEGSDTDDKPLMGSPNDDERTDSDDIPLRLSSKKGNKSSSSLVTSSLKKKDGKKLGSGKNVQVKNQAPSVSDDDGMNVSLKSVLKTATKGEGKLEKSLSNSSKRKRSVGKTKVAEIVKYDDSLVDQKVKVWWPADKMYYEGVVASFDAVKNKHKVLYLDGEEEALNLKKEKWEIIQEYNVQNEEKAPEVEVDTTDVLETPKKKKARIDSGASATQEKSKDSAKQAGGGKSKGAASKSAGKSKGKGKVVTKSKPVNLKEVEKSKDEDLMISKSNTKTQEPPQKIVYKRGKKKNENKIADNEERSDAKESNETKSISENVKESEDVEGEDQKEAEGVKEKSTGTPKIGSKSGKKRKKT